MVVGPHSLAGKNSFRWPAEGEVVITNYDILPAGDTYSPSGKTYKLPVPTPGWHCLWVTWWSASTVN